MADLPPSPSLRRRLVRSVRIAAALSMVIAGVAVLLVSRGQSEPHVHMLIATALGIGLTALLGMALMTLIFVSNRSGHDAAAGAPPAESPDP